MRRDLSFVFKYKVFQRSYGEYCMLAIKETTIDDIKNVRLL